MNAYKSAAQDLAEQQLTVETDAKDPATLIESDLKNLSAARLTSLMDSGQLAHLGIGARRRPRWHQ